MAYRELSKLFYASSEADRFSWLDAEAGRRRSSLSSVGLGIDSGHGEMFVAMPPDMLALVEEVHASELAIALKFNSLPLSAHRALVRGLVLDEVVSTNAIEGVNSTRRQVADALASAPAASPRRRRFRELALLYLSLADGEGPVPETPADVRAVYDRVMDGEDLGANAPDGELFRAGGVEVVGPGGKVVHEGLEPEGRIVEALEAMIELDGREGVPVMVAALASHYLFEFAHPFYDGNGRTGRYLLSLSLSRVLSVPTVLSLSRSILESRDAYYRAFRSAGDPLNRGELTFFVTALLRLLRSAQESVSHEMDRAIFLSEEASGNLGLLAERDGIPPKERDVLGVLAQMELFGMAASSGMEDIAEAVGVKAQMARKHVARLEERGLVVKASARPLRVVLSEAAKEELGISGL